MKEPKSNVTNLTISANSTSSTTTASNLTTSPPTPQSNHNENTKPVSPKKRKEYKYTKNMKKRIYFDNNTKGKKKRPFYHKTPTQSPKESSITATDKTTSSEVQTKNIEASPDTHCSIEECVKWKACWRDIKRSHECACDEAACRRGLKASAHAGNENERKTKGGYELSLYGSVVCCSLRSCDVTLENDFFWSNLTTYLILQWAVQDKAAHAINLNLFQFQPFVLLMFGLRILLCFSGSENRNFKLALLSILHQSPKKAQAPLSHYSAVFDNHFTCRCV